MIKDEERLRNEILSNFRKKGTTKDYACLGKPDNMGIIYRFSIKRIESDYFPLFYKRVNKTFFNTAYHFISDSFVYIKMEDYVRFLNEYLEEEKMKKEFDES